jgi:hypothetical protein
MQTMKTYGPTLVSVTLMIASIIAASGAALAVDVGQAAPDFKLPSTIGGDISLSDFRGKKWVLLEFYGADFAPT